MGTRGECVCVEGDLEQDGLEGDVEQHVEAVDGDARWAARLVARGEARAALDGGGEEVFRERPEPRPGLAPGGRVRLLVDPAPDVVCRRLCVVCSGSFGN